MEYEREHTAPIGPEQVAQAAAILQRYKAGKAGLDQRILDNEQWFCMRHWKNHRNPMMEGKPQPASGWLFNSIANKHADAMDNYPEPCVLPRAAGRRSRRPDLVQHPAGGAGAGGLRAGVQRCLVAQAQAGHRSKRRFLGPGEERRGGYCGAHHGPADALLGAGVMDIQNSPNLFSLSLEDTAQLVQRWPQLKGHEGSTLDLPRYVHDSTLDTSSKSVVVDWYYKRRGADGRTRLHYCKFCNGVVLYASQNDPELCQRGFYDHGKYPFVFDPLFLEEDSPAGFGYIDVMKDCQTAIDKLNQAMDENVLLAAKQRYVLSDTAGVNEEELADLSRDIVHVAGRLGEEGFRPIQAASLQGASLSYRNSRIEELKEISGNRDLTSGGTSGGVTAASAIAALQEAGSKLSRDMLKSAYRRLPRSVTWSLS